MGLLRRFWAIFLITLKRMVAQRGLSLATSLGVISAVALTMSIPIYADAVYQNILNKQITPEATADGQQVRPPFAYLFRYVGAWSGPVTWEQLQPADNYLSGRVSQDLGLPSRLFVRYFKTDTLKLFPADETSYDSAQEPLAWMYFGALSQVQDHIRLLEGSLPAEVASTEGVVEVLINEARATLLGAQVGDEFTMYTLLKNEQASVSVQYPVRIVGIWTAADPADEYWFYAEREYNDALLVPQTTFTERIIPYLNGNVYLAAWYWVMDGSAVQSADVPGLVSNIINARQTAANLITDMRLDISPEEDLTRFLTLSRSLTIFLYAFSIPLLFMILTFIGLVVDMSVGQRRNEIAVLRSRGSTTGQLMGMAVLESTLLAGVGLLVGAPLARVVAIFFGKARSFLDFSAQTGLDPAITTGSMRLGLLAALVTVVAMTLPTLGAARHTVITYKQDRARSLRGPWWQRAFLDVMLLLPAGYGMYLLQRSAGAVDAPAALSADPFENPLLLLVPALGIFAVALLVIRLLPLLMRGVAWAAAGTPSVGLLMAARYLSRSSASYSAPLILLVMTLSLSTFTATLAQTLDRHMHDQTYYKVGADMHVVELGELEGAGVMAGGPGANTAAESTEDAPEEEAQQRWFFLPVSEHLKVPGVQAAARVARVPARVKAGQTSFDAVYMGVDRVDFSRVAYWRRDFAPSPLGGLMNDLARTTEGVIVSRDVLDTYGLKPGDSLPASIFALGGSTVLDFKIVGVFDYFPTWYPEEGPLVVGNLDYLFESVGGEFPYDVWLRTDSNVDYDQMLAGFTALYKRVTFPRISSLLLTEEQLRPERQGFFGLLSVGFVALAFLTVLGFLLYALFSFRRRFIELGMLRAIGLSAGQMMVFLASELAFIFLCGLGAGTGMGVWVSSFFIPHLQVGNDMAARIPPFLVRVDWTSVFQVYILFGILFGVALAVLGWLLMRMKIFQAIKLGEAV
ncbi:MAG: ABC transporter permease [Anaerolineae bacterium]|nr:ABC transporter permease [Anaerolineae bacterium]